MSISCFTTETIWDADFVGIGSVAGGESLLVGRGAHWTPERLLLLAVESSMMTTVLEEATRRGIELLGYVSRAHLDRTTAGEPQVSLALCAVVGSEADPEKVRSLVERAGHDAVVAQLLTDRLTLEVDVRLLPCAPV